MKSNLLITTILAAGALALPLHAQTPAPSASPAPAAGGNTELAATPSPGAAAEKLHFGGTVSAVDATAKTVTVQNKKQGPRTFQLTDTTKVTKTDGTAATLDDVKAGDHVHGAYTKDADGKMSLLTLKVGPAVKKAGKK